MNLKALVDDLSELFLSYLEADFEIKLLFGVVSVNEAKILRNMLVEKNTSYSSVDYLCFGMISAYVLGNSNLDSRVDRNIPFIVSHNSLIEVTEYFTLALFAGLVDSKIIRTEYHILSRNCNRTTV